jgi:hypothetical protein
MLAPNWCRTARLGVANTAAALTTEIGTIAAMFIQQMVQVTQLNVHDHQSQATAKRAAST